MSSARMRRRERSSTSSKPRSTSAAADPKCWGTKSWPVTWRWARFRWARRPKAGTLSRNSFPSCTRSSVVKHPDDGSSVAPRDVAPVTPGAALTLDSPRMIVKAVCPHDCPDTCSMLVTVEDGRAIRIAGNPEHSFTNGFLCTKVAKYLERTYHPDRLQFPQIRIAAKGEGKFRRATWDEALTLIASR